MARPIYTPAPFHEGSELATTPLPRTALLQGGVGGESIVLTLEVITRSEERRTSNIEHRTSNKGLRAAQQDQFGGRGWILDVGSWGRSWFSMAVLCLPLSSLAGPTKVQLDFFENRIRPIFADNCYKCHSPAMGKLKGGLELDWKGGWQKGGDSGPVIVPGDPEKSRLLKAVSYADPDLQMPPKGERLSEAQVNDLVAWVKMGAPDPRTTRPAVETTASVGSGKDHWAFKPVKKPPPPPVKNEAWIRNDVDRFVLAQLEANGMAPNEAADKQTLMRRVYYDLIGLPPTAEEVDDFLNDDSAK